MRQNVRVNGPTVDKTRRVTDRAESPLNACPETALCET